MANRPQNVLAAAIFALVALSPATAQAQADAPTHAGLSGWSIVGSETVAPARPVVDVQAGWPSTTFGYTFGLSPTTDVSLRLGRLYGFEGTTQSRRAGRGGG